MGNILHVSSRRNADSSSLRSLYYLHNIRITEEELGANLLADDLGPDEVLLGQTQPHLL